jgi:hypothetical protein
MLCYVVLFYLLINWVGVIYLWIFKSQECDLEKSHCNYDIYIYIYIILKSFKSKV